MSGVDSGQNAEIRTARERALPSPQVFSDLWHLDVRIELVNFVENVVLVVITKSVLRSLLSYMLA